MAATRDVSACAPTNFSRVESVFAELRDFLVAAKNAVGDEIRAYPTPIPRCDAQFNHLYEQRLRISDALERANTLSHDDDWRELMTFLAAFAASSRYTDEASEQALRERVRTALSTAPLPRNRRVHA